MSKPYWNVFKTTQTAPWPKVGVAFINKDGSYNMRLKASVIVGDKLQMRQAKQKMQSKDQGAEAGMA